MDTLPTTQTTFNDDDSDEEDTEENCEDEIEEEDNGQIHSNDFVERPADPKTNASVLLIVGPK